MGNQYSAIETDISSVALNGKSGSWELGNEYTANKKIKVIACRIYAQSEQTVKARLWDSSGNKLAESVETLCEKDSWTTLMLNNPVELEEGKNYVISAGFSSYYSVDSSVLSFAKSVSFVQSRYIGTLGSYPSNIFNKKIYGLVDMIFEEDATKYLVRNNGTLYTVSNGALVEVSGTLNADLFMNSGADAIPDGALLMTLSAPEVLCWTNGDRLPTLTATVKGIPEPQVVVTKEIDLMHSSIKGINGVTVDCKGDVLFAVSFDKKTTWMMHNGTEWVAVSDKLAGMTKTEFEAITTEQWQPKYEASSDMYIRCILFDETQSITTVNIDFIN